MILETFHTNTGKLIQVVLKHLWISNSYGGCWNKNNRYSICKEY